MGNPFLAKTKNRETIIEHTDKLYKNFLDLKRIYPNIENLDWYILKLACLYHDLGKMNIKFQNKLIKKLNAKSLEEGRDDIIEELKDNFYEIDEIPHGYLSAAFLPKQELKEKYSKDELRILYQSIYYHHTRDKLENHDNLMIIVKEELSNYIDEFNYEKIPKIEKLNPSFIKYVKRRIPDERDSNEVAKQYIITKGLLNKIDYSASGDIDVEIENKNLFEKTYDYLKIGGFKPNKLQEYMIAHQEHNNIIRASTGIGKTEAALFWIGNNKGFFTLPLKVSINAIYDRIVDKIKFEKENTALLHSETSLEYLKRNNNELDKEYINKTKQLSLPLTVCTLDQLIDFIFKYEGYELKLATLSYSKLVIDEIQMYSPELVAYLIVALKQITEMGGKFSIVTATLPPVFTHFIKDNVKDLKIPEPFYKEVEGKMQLRHKLNVIKEDINVEHLKKNYKDKKILVIVNTVKKAQEIYDVLQKELVENSLVKDNYINMLHSRFTKEDRGKKEDEILTMGKLENKQCGIWITTQVVEASLDIDFDLLYTELSDISGLFQRMGRVYRNRTLKDNITNIYVYVGANKFTSGIGNSDKSIIDKDIFNLSKEALINYVGSSDGKEINEVDKMNLVEKVYSVENLGNTEYYSKIKNVIDKMSDIKAFEYNKKDINLRNIENTNIIPKEVYEENKDFIQENADLINNTNKLNARIIARNNINKFVISIPTYEFKRANENGYIHDFVEISEKVEIPVMAYKYSNAKGLERPKENMKEFNEQNQFM